MEDQYKALIAKQANLALKKKLEFEVWLLEQQVRERSTPAHSRPFVTINLIPIMSVHPLVESPKQISCFIDIITSILFSQNKFAKII